MQKIFFLFLLVVAPTVAAWAQILDDSTKLVYGPNTTLVTTPQALKDNQLDWQPIDTSLVNFQRFSWVDQSRHHWQDLGVNGTATRPIFYHMPNIIGARSGFTLYNAYYRGPDQVRLFDAKSPYTNLYIVLGSNGRSVADIEYARNINPRWNISARYKRITSDKQIGVQVTRGDRNVVATNFDLATNYRSKDGKYKLIAQITGMNHVVTETGGVIQTEFDTLKYLYDEAPIRLNDAETRELRQHYHVYHQYQISKLLQVYHQADKERVVNYFSAFNLSGSDGDFFENTFIRTDSTKDKFVFRSFTNQLGVKGDVGPLYYNVYLRRRDVNVPYKHLPIERQIGENYAGFKVRLATKSGNGLYGGAEYLNTGPFMVYARLKSPWLTAKATRQVAQPGLVQQRWLGNHFEWNNNFTDITTDRLEAQGQLTFGPVDFRPKGSFTRVNGYVYYDTAGLPAQAGATQILTLGTDLNFKFGAIHWENEFIYTNLSGSGSYAFRIPELFINSNLYYLNTLFNGNLRLQVGLDMHWQSDYEGMDYDPALMQFFLQDGHTIQNYLAADFYLNIKINRTLVFAKMTHINMGIQAQGYEVTYDYPGMPRAFDLGLRWMFFD